GGIRADHADERDVREIQPLRHHLRADEYLRFALPKIAEDAGVRAFAGRRVPIHACHPRRGEDTQHLLLDLLRGDAERLDLRAAAVRAGLRRAARVFAVMALEGAVVSMEGERDGAVRTACYIAAVAAEDELRVAAPVQEEDTLLFVRQTARHRVHK